MASISSFPDSSCIFMGNPIVYRVTPGKIQGVSISFHRVKMNVTILGHEFELSQPVDPGTTFVEFDISGCFRAAAELYDITPVATRVDYPEFSTTLIAVKDVWVEGGVSRSGGHFTASNRSAIMGGYSDFERLHTSTTVTFTRKPVHGELVCPGDRVVIPELSKTAEIPSPENHYSLIAPSSVAHDIASDAEGAVIISGRTFYVVPADRRSLQFQFLNSRGCVESIRAWGLDTEKMKTSRNSVSISRFERFREFSRSYMHKSLAPSEFTMTSGYVDYEWAKWWSYEFCTASRHWMLVDGLWVPCSVSIDESLSVFDRSKTAMCSIAFTVLPDLNGALW